MEIEVESDKFEGKILNTFNIIFVYKFRRVGYHYVRIWLLNEKVEFCNKIYVENKEFEEMKFFKHELKTKELHQDNPTDNWSNNLERLSISFNESIKAKEDFNEKIELI